MAGTTYYGFLEKLILYTHYARFTEYTIASAYASGGKDGFAGVFFRPTEEAIGMEMHWLFQELPY